MLTDHQIVLLFCGNNKGFSFFETLASHRHVLRQVVHINFMKAQKIDKCKSSRQIIGISKDIILLQDSPSPETALPYKNPFAFSEA